MKITKTQLRRIIKEELKEYAMAEEPPMGGPPAPRGQFDELFEEGQPGNILAEAVARSLMLDDESDFEAVVRAIKDSLERWREYR